MKFIELLARVLMALIFLLAGLNKISNFDATQGYMEVMGVPILLLVPTIIFEIGGALALMVGFKIRLFSIAFAVFCITSAILFHNNIADQMQFVLFMKNMAMCGGFLLLFKHGSEYFSIDSMLEHKLNKGNATLVLK